MQQNCKKGRTSYRVRWFHAPQRHPGPRFRRRWSAAPEYLRQFACCLRYRLVYTEFVDECSYRAGVVYVKQKEAGQSLSLTEKQAVLL